MVCCVVCIGVDDSELSDLGITGYPHGLAVQDDVHEGMVFASVTGSCQPLKNRDHIRLNFWDLRPFVREMYLVAQGSGFGCQKKHPNSSHTCTCSKTVECLGAVRGTQKQALVHE